MQTYYRPIVQNDPAKPDRFYYLGDQTKWFDKVEVTERGKNPVVVSAKSIPSNALEKITSRRYNHYFQSFSKPLIMGILNVTPDSFFDGGKHFRLSEAMKAVDSMIRSGVNIIDVGGESTRPGARQIPEELEIERIEPIITNIKRDYPKCKISVDTRKSSVMSRVIKLGVNFINDVSALTFDQKSLEILSKENVQVCLMHGGLDPTNMQNNTSYDDVLLDVYDYLNDCIEFAIAGGIKKENIIIDPGIGFGKTSHQNILLIRKASLFHSLGCPILYGVSRKSFIGKLGRAADPADRFPGSIAVAIELIRQGVQLIRVHDVLETRQALDLVEAIQKG